MSRIGKQPVQIPDKVKVSVEGNTVSVEGPVGALERTLHEFVSVEASEEEVVISRKDDSREARSMHGLARSLLSNMVAGVTEGFTRKLEINGVGYRANKKGNFIRFDLGYSHPIFYELPEGIDAEIDRDNNITLKGCDKELVGQVAATIRGFRKPEPYKGKGIKYAEEIIQRKVGKAGATAK